MWVWREETVRGGWRLDSTGSWTYDEPARLERVGPPRVPRDPDRLARERFVRAQRARSEGRRPVPVGARPDFEATPIFRSVAHEVREWHDERRGDERYPEPRHETGRRAEPAIPEPHPGSGPFPAPAEDELRRRAERRRRPRVEPESGRHALRP